MKSLAKFARCARNTQRGTAQVSRRSIAVAMAVVALFAQHTQAEIVGTSVVDFLPGPNADRAVFATHAPGRPNDLFVVEQSGKIHRLDLITGRFDTTPFLDIENLVDDQENEQGLLGLAFHPDFASNGHFYVNYTRDPGPGLDRTRIDRFTAINPALSTTVNPSTRSSVLEFNQDFANHNGGWIGFSPVDDYLYIATGDGGSGNDPNNRAQDLSQLLGKMLRIDVDGSSAAGGNYSIPTDNPFANDGNANTRDEIWAYGLRNPWRSSFDRETGDLWIGDVGQGAREEINFQPADRTAVANYGWRLREGDIQTPGVGGPIPPNYLAPVYDYVSNGSGLFGGNSVVGGYVYRGPDPEVRGRYFFADSFPTQLWTFDPSDPNGTVQNVESTLDPSASINTPVSFGEDANGNLYILGSGSGVYRIETDALSPGDYNADGLVDIRDYQVWRSSYGAQDSPADGDNSGVVDAADYTIWRDAFTAASNSGAGSLATPEPTACLLMLGALVALCNPRRARRY